MMAMGLMIPEYLLFHTVFWLCGSLSSKKGNTHFLFVEGNLHLLKLRQPPPTFGGGVAFHYPRKRYLNFLANLPFTTLVR